MSAESHKEKLDRLADRLGRVIAEYLVTDDQEKPAFEELLVRNPQVADALREIFKTHQQSTIGSETSSKGASLRSEALTIDFGSDVSGQDGFHLQSSDSFAIAGNIQPPPRKGRFGDYELIEEIARGGMGVVYKARQLSLNRIVALKMIRDGRLVDSDVIRRFRAEAEAVAKLDHPSIVPVYEVGQIEGHHFFSMGYVDGGTLTDKVRDGPLPPRAAAELVMKVAEAIAYAHQRGIVHRDLKPANVLLDSRGEPKVTDFGLAKQLEDETNLTVTGQILGTPAYMPPEQAAGKKGEVSTLVDVYALGAILYHLITGQPPFQAQGPLDVVLQVLDREAEPPSKHNRAVPGVLERICQRAMEKRPENRYPSAASMAADLRLFLKNEPVIFAKDQWSRRLERWWRGEPLLVAHWGGIAATMLISWGHKLFYGTDTPYLLELTYVFGIWSVATLALQKWMNHHRWRQVAGLAWGAVDVLLFTTVVHMVREPRGILLIGYAVLIASSGLFLRVRYVWLMTVASMLALVPLIVLHQQELWSSHPHYLIIFAACLAIVGLSVATVVKRVRTLRQYYEGEA